MADPAWSRSLDQSPPAVPSHLDYPAILNALSGNSWSFKHSAEASSKIFQYGLFITDIVKMSHRLNKTQYQIKVRIGKKMPN